MESETPFMPTNQLINPIEHGIHAGAQLVEFIALR